MKFELYINGQPELKIWLDYAEAFGEEKSNEILQSYLNIALLYQALGFKQTKVLDKSQYSIREFTKVVDILKIDHKQIYDWGFDWLKRMIECDWLYNIRYEVCSGTNPEFILKNYPTVTTLDLFKILNIIYTEQE